MSSLSPSKRRLLRWLVVFTSALGLAIALAQTLNAPVRQIPNTTTPTAKPITSLPLQLQSKYDRTLAHHATVSRSDGSFRRMFIETTAFAAIQPEKPLPDGTSIVMETWYSPSTGQVLQAQTGTRFDFHGRFLAVLSDADMEASAYIDGKLGDRTPEMTDTLTLIPLSEDLSKASPVTLPVSNSVMAWPNNLAFSPDGQFAFVTETFAPAPQGATERSQIPLGQQLAVIDVSNLRQPKIVNRINLGTRPMAVAVHPDGNLLAVSLGEAGRQIALIPFTNGRLGTPTFQGHPNLTDANVHTPHLEWHPSGRFLGVTLPERNEALFYAVDRTHANRPRLRSWGNAIITGKLPGVGHFTPDGRHFIVTNLYWGSDVANQFVGVHHSSLTVIQFADAAGADKQVKHQIVSTAAVGASAEEFAISPDGRFVVSLNMEASYLPLTDSRRTQHSSLTLLSLNPETGRLMPHGTTPFEGILPEGITFDASGRYLAVATFDYHDPQRQGGGVDFWRVTQQNTPALQKLDRSIPVMRGAHIVKLVR